MTPDLSADFAKVRNACERLYHDDIRAETIDALDRIEAALKETQAEIARLNQTRHPWASALAERTIDEQVATIDRLTKEVAALRQQLRERDDEVTHNPMIEVYGQ